MTPNFHDKESIDFQPKMWILERLGRRVHHLAQIMSYPSPISFFLSFLFFIEEICKLKNDKRKTK